MIAIARRDYPDLRFEVGTMTDLDLADDSLAGIVAFWSVIHVPDHAMPGVFEQFRRVLRPQGPLLVGFHVGDEIRHTSEGYTGRPINVDTHHRRPSKVAGWLRDARFTIEAELVIGPDKDVPGSRHLCAQRRLIAPDDSRVRPPGPNGRDQPRWTSWTCQAGPSRTRVTTHRADPRPYGNEHRTVIVDELVGRHCVDDPEHDPSISALDNIDGGGHEPNAGGRVAAGPQLPEQLGVARQRRRPCGVDIIEGVVVGTGERR